MAMLLAELILTTALLSTPVDSYAGGTGVCWDVRLKKHVPCGWEPNTTPPPSEHTPSSAGFEQSYSPTPQELERQRRNRESIMFNNKGVELSKAGNLEEAIIYYEKAIAVDSTNNTAIKNLRLEKGRMANDRGNKCYEENEDFECAIRFYKDALHFLPDEQVVKNNLKSAEEKLEIQKERLADENKRKANRRKAEMNIDSILNQLKDYLSHSEASSNSKTGMDFMKEDATFLPEDIMTSNVVDLRDIEPKESVVDPRVVKGELSADQAKLLREQEMKVKAEIMLAQLMVSKGEYDNAISMLKSALETRQNDQGIQKTISFVYYLKGKQENMEQQSPRTIALLDAFELGKGQWDVAMESLKNNHYSNPADLGVRDAYNFAAGLCLGLGEYSPELFEFLGEKSAPRAKPVKEIVIKALSAQSKEDYENSVLLLKQALELVPDDLGIRDVLNYNEGLLAAQQFQQK